MSVVEGDGGGEAKSEGTDSGDGGVVFVERFGELYVVCLRSDVYAKV